MARGTVRSRDGALLAYEEAGSGFPLLLVHGFPLNRRMWAKQLSLLGRGRRVIAVDLRGHGESSVPPGVSPPSFSMELFARDLADLMDFLGLDGIDLCGLSMGGYVAMAFLRSYPERVRSLILASTRATADPPEGVEARRAVAERVMAEGMEGLAREMTPRLLGPEAPREVAELVEEMIRGTRREVAAADSLAMAARPDSRELLARAGVPILVIHGAEDALVPVEQARAMAENIPGSLFRVIPGAGHLPPLEAPEAWAEAVGAFLSGLG